jgi:hypothetical protein|uniref:Uncharacterized protein n=1 Tax=viral metagenome TaxID=1070528 RepID=A0A6C0INK0_9ZZZZ
MDLNQRKLKKSEWNSIEVPVSDEELSVLNMIKSGYHNVNIKVNKGNSIFTFLKINYNENSFIKIEEFLFNKYLKSTVDTIESKIIKIQKANDFENKYKKISLSGITRLNSADKIRLENCSTIEENKAFEFILLKYVEKVLYYCHSKNAKELAYNYYTLLKLSKASIAYLNKYVVQICHYVIESIEMFVKKESIIENAVNIIETNKNLLKYSDMKLYDHQKKIFSVCKQVEPKLVLYIAPTGTGKTLTPIGLSEDSRIIFVCAARHVGLALARSAISIGKKVAFAFGCASADDIRLHYFAAKEFTKNRKSGGIGKVDNSIGDKVEIMICDIKSYLPAMYYMLAFNHKSDIIMYWDEPTITMDYEEHEFHQIIKNNWKENKIPNVVLSSATLPQMNEISDVIEDYKGKQFIIDDDDNDDDNDDEEEHYIEPLIENIVSHDCKKSIPIVNSSGYVVLPHYLDEDYDKIKKIASHCESHKTLMRYFDLDEVVKFITFINENNYIQPKFKINRQFDSIQDIDMISIKEYYIKLLKNVMSGTWGAICIHMKSNRKRKLVENDSVDTKGNRVFKKMNSVDTSRQIPTHSVTTSTSNVGIYVSTKDAFSLTDGPTIYICENVRKIATFCVQQANIPSAMMTNIMNKIEYNNKINEKIKEVEDNLEFKQEQMDKTNDSKSKGIDSKSKSKNKKVNREMNNDEGKSDIAKLTNELNSLRSMIKSAVLNDMFIPNSTNHIEKWAREMNTERSFTANIEEHIVGDIMSINGIEDSWKVLLMMGIGVFVSHPSIAYTEIMKTLADEQKLFMIIASSDYIYGTNYQFCHAYLGKDLNLTQEKIIQAMGRVGRNNIQQTYTLRFRDNSQILKLFTDDTEKPEVVNMNKLLISTEEPEPEPASQHDNNLDI